MRRLHWGQLKDVRWPQFKQKLASAAFAVWQLLQIIKPSPIPHPEFQPSTLFPKLHELSFDEVDDEDEKYGENRESASRDCRTVQQFLDGVPVTLGQMATVVTEHIKYEDVCSYRQWWNGHEEPDIAGYLVSEEIEEYARQQEQKPRHGDGEHVRL
jgi:hypothetical protein